MTADLQNAQEGSANTSFKMFCYWLADGTVSTKLDNDNLYWKVLGEICFTVL